MAITLLDRLAYGVLAGVCGVFVDPKDAQMKLKNLLGYGNTDSLLSPAHFASPCTITEPNIQASSMWNTNLGSVQACAFTPARPASTPFLPDQTRMRTLPASVPAYPTFATSMTPSVTLDGQITAILALLSLLLCLSFAMFYYWSSKHSLTSSKDLKHEPETNIQEYIENSKRRIINHVIEEFYYLYETAQTDTNLLALEASLERALQASSEQARVAEEKDTELADMTTKLADLTTKSEALEASSERALQASSEQARVAEEAEVAHGKTLETITAEHEKALSDLEAEHQARHQALTKALDEQKAQHTRTLREKDAAYEHRRQTTSTAHADALTKKNLALQQKDADLTAAQAEIDELNRKVASQTKAVRDINGRYHEEKSKRAEHSKVKAEQSKAIKDLEAKLREQGKELSERAEQSKAQAEQSKAIEDLTVRLEEQGALVGKHVAAAAEKEDWIETQATRMGVLETDFNDLSDRFAAGEEKIDELEHALAEAEAQLEEQRPADQPKKKKRTVRERAEKAKANDVIWVRECEENALQALRDYDESWASAARFRRERLWLMRREAELCIYEGLMKAPEGYKPEIVFACQ